MRRAAHRDESRFRVSPRDVPFLSLSTSATTPGRHFAAGMVASFAEGRIGYREWARRNGKLGDIRSLDDQYDHDVDELIG
jgi:hypothetical protein